MRKLIIAEKPSVARDIAKALGAKWNKKLGCYVSDFYYITFFVGHMVITDNGKMGFKGWDKCYVHSDDLIFKPNSKVDKVTAKVLKLLDLEDCEGIISATDNDRAGQAIMDNFIKFYGITHPVERFWTSDILTKNVVLHLLDNLEPNEKYVPYGQSENLRNYLDNQVGVNATTLYALKKAKPGVSLGRVQTTVAVEILNRCDEIENFSSKKFYRIQLTLKLNGVKYVVDSNERLTEEEVNALSSFTDDSINLVSSETKDHTKFSEPLFNKSSLIVEASRKLKSTSNEIGKMLQDSYEVKKITSYPRSAFRYLNEDLSTKTKFSKIVSELSELEDSQVVYDRAMRSGKLIYDNTKIKGHYAIIILNSTKAKEVMKGNTKLSKLLKIIKTRMLCRSSNPIEFTETKIHLTYKGLNFELTGRNINKEGWLLYDKSKTDTYSYKNALVGLNKDGIFLEYVDSTSVDSSTKAPFYYTDSSIMKWMEKNRIGTEATRDGYVEKLINRGYIVREGLSLKRTQLGEVLRVDTSDKLISKVELTSKMEDIIESIIDSDDLNGFENNKKIVSELSRMIYEDLNSLSFEKFVKENPTTKCVCGGLATIYPNNVKCPHCNRNISRVMLSKKLTDNQLKSLMAGKYTKVYGMKSKSGKMDRKVCINKEGKLDMKFM